MRWLKAPISLFLALNICALLVIPPTQAREMSKAGEVFQKVQAGVVTIFTGAGHGSGFLADQAGLIITNSHVVNESAGDLRIKFGRNQIVEATVIENDREHDIAVLKVNLKRIDDLCVLPIYPGSDSTVLVGEQVLAIGTPIDKESLEKLMTVGVVGKFDGEVIYHDASINGGNSGGPLLNFDGQVVGINTFTQIEKRPTVRPGGGVIGMTPIRGPGGAVPAKYLSAALERARPKTLSVHPSAELLPDVPEVPYPVSQFLKTNPEFFTVKRSANSTIDSSSFEFRFATPPKRYAQSINLQNEFLGLRAKRAKRKKFLLTVDEFDYLNKKYYDYEKPVVQISIHPKTKLTEGTKARNASVFLGAATLTALSGGVLAPLLALPLALPQNQEYKKDFLRLALVGEDGQTIATPVETGRAPCHKQLLDALGNGPGNLDKSYIGKYAFDATAFNTEKNLVIVIAAEGTDKTETIKIPNKLKQQIVADFQPYWEYVEQQKSVKAVRVVSAESDTSQ